jgi:hypothetical protein
LCLRADPLVACHRHYPGETVRLRLFSKLTTAAFPVRAAGRLSQLAFSRLARRSLPLWPADSLSRPEDGPLTSKALDCLLPPNRLGLLPGAQPLPGRGLAPLGFNTPKHNARPRREPSGRGGYQPHHPAPRVSSLARGASRRGAAGTNPATNHRKQQTHGGSESHRTVSARRDRPTVARLACLQPV